MALAPPHTLHDVGTKRHHPANLPPISDARSVLLEAIRKGGGNARSSKKLHFNSKGPQTVLVTRVTVSPFVLLRHSAAKSGGAARAGGQTRARGQRRGHHLVAPHRRGVFRLRGRVRVRRRRLDGVMAAKQKKSSVGNRGQISSGTPIQNPAPAHQRLPVFFFTTLEGCLLLFVFGEHLRVVRVCVSSVSSRSSCIQSFLRCYVSGLKTPTFPIVIHEGNFSFILRGHSFCYCASTWKMRILKKMKACCIYIWFSFRFCHLVAELGIEQVHFILRSFF